MRNLALFVVCFSFAIASRPAHASTGPQPIVTNLAGYNLVFDEEFNKGPNFNAELSEWGPITPPLRWIMHTPYAGDFGDASFGAGRMLPSADSNGLNIKCYYDTTRAHWQVFIDRGYDESLREQPDLRAVDLLAAATLILSERPTKR
jgi:hypothetical protein